MIQPFIPMAMVLVDEPFDDPNYLYQIKWDGVRMVAYLDESGVRLVNRRLNDHTDNYPELQALPSMIKGRSAVLDGEIVAIGTDGKPSFSNILKRDLSKSPEKIRMMSRSIPIYFMVFDLLYLDDRWLVDEPLVHRQERLASVLTETEQVKIVGNQPSGTALFQVMREQGMEGIVCKEKQGLYKIGERSDTWKKVKYIRTIHAVVGGATLKGGRVNSLVLGAYADGKLICIGKAGSGLSGSDIQALTAFARGVKDQPCPFAVRPKLLRSTYDELIWFPPQLVAEVNYMEWTSDLTLRAPAIQGFVQRDPASCGL